MSGFEVKNIDKNGDVERVPVVAWKTFCLDSI